MTAIVTVARRKIPYSLMVGMVSGLVLAAILLQPVFHAL
jgi:hypothetical protein